MKLWCEHAWLGGGDVKAGVVIAVDDERIAEVEAGVAEPPAGAERLAGITIPGLANAHSHAFHRALRGRTHGGRGDFWSWREQMYSLAELIDPDRYLALARATFAEMALAGVTAVGEFHYLHHRPDGKPYDDPNEMGLAMVEAARQAGIRITLLDTCYLHGDIGRQPTGSQRRFSDGSAARWAERAEALSGDTRTQVGAAIHSVRAVEPAEAAEVAAWADAREVPLHAHVSEQPRENADCLAAHGRTPTAVLDHAGAVSERFTAVHGTHLEGGDVALLGSRRATCCLCPTTERDLADGVGPALELAGAGARLAVGSDSHAVVDLLEEARAIDLDQRLEAGDRALHRPMDLLRAATEDGHRCLGWTGAGRIADGAPADLVTVGLENPRMAGTEPVHALPSLVFAATAADVRDVMVGGEWIVREARHVSIDVARELDEAVKGAWQ